MHDENEKDTDENKEKNLPMIQAMDKMIGENSLNEESIVHGFVKIRPL